MANTNDDLNTLLMSVPEAAGLLGISRNLAYELIRQRRIPSVRLGRRILVPRQSLEAWIEREAGLPGGVPGPLSFPAQRH